MNNLVIVTSSIQVKPGKFTYSQTRSKFDSDERFRQTIGTVSAIKASLPKSKVVIVDSSEVYSEYQTTFGYMDNVEFIPLKELSSEAYELSNSHINKSLCESILLQAYYTQYKKYIKQFDFVIKICGRYLFFGLDTSVFNEQNKDKIFFKKPIQFEWSDGWRYDFVDRRHLQNDNKLNQYCTVLYAYGANNLERFMDINEANVHLLNRNNMVHFDLETLMYYYTRPFQSDVIETDWKVSGWGGTSGRFMYY